MPNILYIDSDEVFASAIIPCLQIYGCQVHGIKDSSQACDLFRKDPFDLLIVDQWCGPRALDAVCEAYRRLPLLRNSPRPVLIVGPEELGTEEFKWVSGNHFHFLIKYKHPEEWFQKITTVLSTGCPS